LDLACGHRFGFVPVLQAPIFVCTGIRTGPCSKVAKQVAAWVVLGNVPWHKMGGCLEKRTLKAHLIAISQLSAHVFLIG
jgi:hypothetical protein